MSELKAEHGLVVYEQWKGGYYRKSEADKVIAHRNAKYCKAMAKASYKQKTNKTALEWYRFLKKWHNKWLELAEHFKEMAKCT